MPFPTGFDPQAASDAGAFVEAAYTTYQRDRTSETPPVLGLPSGWQLAAWVTMTDFLPIGGPLRKFYGLIAVPSAGSGAVLAIRGTIEWYEWYDNAMVSLMAYKTSHIATGFGRIYSGLAVKEVPGVFEEAPAALSGTFAEQVAAVVQKHQPNSDLELARAATPTIVVGHSLGAALASLYVLDNAAGGHSVSPTLYTFASPRVGDGAFVDAFKATGARSWRIENAPDLVPDMPPDSLGYRHLDTQILIDSSGKVNSSESCFHAMRTHRHLLDARVALDGACQPGSADEVMLVP